MRHLALGTFVIAATAAAPRVADACSCAGHVYNEIWVQDGEVPSNQGGVAWERGNDGICAIPIDFQLRVERVADGQEVPISITPSTDWFHSMYAFVEIEGFGDDDTEYRASTSADGGEWMPVATFRAGPSIGPAQTVALSATAPVSAARQLETDSSCSESYDVRTSTVTVSLSPELERYRDLLFYETLVDGERIRFAESYCSPVTTGRSWRGRGIDEIVAPCGPDADWVRERLPGGVVDVAMRVSVPGTSLQWETAPVTIDLTCPTPVDADAGADPSDADVAGADVGAEDAGTPQATDGGGGCRIAGQRAPETWLLLLVASLFIHRRTRAARD